ncbi:MAG TPA: RsmE family RNA methyltransferase [Candidatus Krumholzibacteria bacterium]
MSFHTFSFYSEDLVPGDTRVWLIDDEHYHIARVLRMGTADRVRVTNGRGLVVTAEIDHVGAKRTSAQIVGVDANHPEPVPLVLSLAMLPRERMDLALTQCTEAGITGWMPIVAERCHVRKTIDRGERWNRIAVAALKQSGRAWLPRIEAPIDARDLPAKFKAFESVVLADMGAAQWMDITAKPVATLAIVGPEAGFTDVEQSHFAGAGARPMHVSSQRLRAETAAIAVVSLLALNRGPV